MVSDDNFFDCFQSWYLPTYLIPLCVDWFSGLERHQLARFSHLSVLIGWLGLDRLLFWDWHCSGMATFLASNCLWSCFLIERELDSGFQLVSDKCWKEFLLLSDSFVWPWIYYQKNRRKHCLNHIFVFLLQININKYKTNLFQLDQMIDTRL